jgi:hypothetical protein
MAPDSIARTPIVSHDLSHACITMNRNSIGSYWAVEHLNTLIYYTFYDKYETLND